ncbi:hypothetical protein Pflav_043130 [Phytohabitans flavus]|uniref:HTH iclR-type domain-containing protein n=1 Tax=Phytohabitans flavus TaxID=1076124 RepID=A0A6F8XVQ4_9ACTN|nr:hypothetical protein Pflav_043130 [Phytohabitans flavus]
MGEPDVRPVRGTATAEDAPTGEFVQSLERGLAVIKAFDTHTELTLSEVARATGLSRGVARRFLHTLVSLGYMSTDGRQFSLRPRVLELGYAYMSNLMLPEIARPHLESLAEKVNEACSITVLEETDVVYVARVPSRHLMGIVINVGTRLPAYATATGRVLLAGLGQAELDEQLTSVRLKRRTERTTVDAGQLRASSRRSAGSGTAWSTRSSKTGYAPSPYRSAALVARWPVPSTSRHRPPGAPPRRWSPTSCARCSTPPRRSARTCAALRTRRLTARDTPPR